MPALDDYDPTVPHWLLICRVLERRPEGLSVTRISIEVVQLSGERFVRASSTSELLERMRADGIVIGEHVNRGRGLPEHRHRLSATGRDLYRTALRLVQAQLFKGKRK